MNFDLNEEQRMLKDAVDRLVLDQYAFDQRARCQDQADGWSRPLWAQFADLGLLGLPFAEEDGGFGAGPVETQIVMEAIGRGLLLEPYLATVVLSGGLLRAAASDAQRAELLPALIGGDLLLAFAHSEAQARYHLADVATTARQEGGGWVLNGAKRFVLHGDCANKLLVSARVSGNRRDEDGIALFLVDATAAGVSRRGYLTQDRLRAADITLDGVRVGAAALLGEAGKAFGAIEQVVDAAIAALCAEAVGAMEQAQALTVDYLKVRKQFGVAIGSFQALQHKAVDMLVMTEQARSMALYASMMVNDPDPLERRRAMSAAKVQIGRSARFVSQQAVQLHGGIGVTEECQIGHYMRRLSMLEFMFGDTDHHLAQLARDGGLIAAHA
ncbi:acyl-CoA dehydrogenase family protein [Pseudomonas citrulli]|jgi:pimeloyl-CoA dehydrogenase small subunit|uniref:Acyl-CoA dehydrogenase family protein n=1 Tax=Pseudomonas lurida TaxID=244566 RepID=A0ABY9FP66_9PSED|nr:MULTISPECIES: acyl-CoA dehydrogenase family protein [Pseudomonas]QDH66515.1 acyl-CoA dehydrogenase [Pseudomonas azotoformans]WLG54852.1 acyl-CoA dehydrogenase family protein [Pseudomonas extremorientalis]WLH05088.1 acyl-CoA dehydrogenase family protein [Pseudomonas lurida]